MMGRHDGMGGWGMADAPTVSHERNVRANNRANLFARIRPYSPLLARPIAAPTNRI